MKVRTDVQLPLLIAMLAIMVMIGTVSADPHVGGLPLTTVQSGTVSGGVYMDAENTWWAGTAGSQDIEKTFATIPNTSSIQWAQLFVVVYCGHMQNNYQGTAAISFDGDGNGVYETALGTEPLNVNFTYLVNGGNNNSGFSGHSTGEPYKMVNDHTNRVTSDYLMWYDVTSAITSQTPKAHVVTTAGDGSFDGRIKMITLVVAYNDGDTDTVYYWVNQGHDADTLHSTTDYVGTTEFDLSAVSGTVQAATLMVNHLASEDGSYNWIGDPIESDPAGGNFQGAYFGYNIWDMTSKVDLGSSNDLSYDRSGDYYKIPLAVLTVKKQTPVVTPVADFSATPLSGETPLNVTFTDLSTGPPTSWKWEYRLGSGAWTQFSTEQNPSYTFTSVGSYRIRLTATNSLGSNQKSSAIGYIIVSAAANPDLTITDMRPVGNTSFARESNSVKTTVKNIGGQASNATTLRLVASDGFSGSAAIPSLASNAETIVTIVDPTNRNLAGGSLSYTATADPDNTVAEASETNNEVTNTYTVTYNGYKGKTYWDGGSNVTTKKTFDLHGNLLHSSGDSAYKAGGVGGGAWNDFTVAWTGTDIPVPSGATVREARLYVPYTWDSSSQVPDHFSVAFNGNLLPDDTWYKDESNFGGYDNYYYGLLAYNVTSFFTTGGNSAVIHKDDSGSNLAMYGLTLAVVYEKAAEPRRQIFLNEEFDILGADEAGYATTPEEATAYVPFSGMTIVPADAVTANLTTFVPSGNSYEGVLLFNGETIASNVWDYGLASGTQVAVDTRDVKADLTGTGNEAGIRSTAGSTPLMAASHAFLVVTYAGTPEPAPVAAFSGTPTSGTAPLAVTFTDESSNTPTSWLWDFGDSDSTNATERNPVHSYATAGTYTVNLTATNAAGSNTTSKADYVTVTAAPVAPVAAFSGTPTAGTAPLTVTFTDESTNTPTSWLWDFGDSDSTNATEQNPVHTYSTPGTYTVNLTATNAAGSNSTVKSGYINVTAQSAPVVNFTATPLTGATPLTIVFTDTSSGNITDYYWDFGDGNTSVQQNDNHTYSTASRYSVNHTVTGPGGSNSTIRTDYITAVSTRPTANFTAVPPLTGTTPLTVEFIDLSTNYPTSWSWRYIYKPFDGNWGLATEFSTEQNPNYTFTGTGWYQIRLYATNAKGTTNKNLGSSTVPYLIVNEVAVDNPDLIVLNIGANGNAATPFAREGNEIVVAIENVNTNNLTTPATNVSFVASDGYMATGIVPAIDAGQFANVYFTDPTLRNLSGSVTYTATVDPSNNVLETNETNNMMSKTFAVVYNGYKGKRYWADGSDVTTKKIFDIRGDILYSSGNSSYMSGSVTGSSWSTYDVGWNTTDIPFPAGATIREAYLYVPYTWDNGNVIPDQIHVSFNDNPLTWENHYQDRSNFGAYGDYDYGLLTYNVTSMFNPTGNTASLSKDNPHTSASMYGLNLVVVYEDLNSTRKQIFMNEEFDLLGACPVYATNEEEATAYVPFDGMSIDMESAVSATLTTFIPSGNDYEGILLVNNNTVATNVWDYGKTDATTKAQVAIDVRDVRALLNTTVNVIGIRGNEQSGTPCMAISQAFLVVEYPGSAPVAAFSGSPTSGTVPLTVQFIDTSTHTPSSWFWDFGDGDSTNATLQNPVHIYTTPGTYTVNLTVTNSLGSNTTTKSNFITVTSSIPAPVANFTAEPTTGIAPLTVMFTDTSENIPTSWAWNFGDGDSTNATVQHPVHTYASAGTYTVTLTATNAGGSNSTTKTDLITVTSTESPPTASFTSDATSGRVPFTVQFTDTTTGSVSGWTWAFGDGGTSTERNPSHTYVTTGTFSVTLTAVGPGGSNSTTQPNLIAVTAPLTSPSYNGGIPLTTTQNGSVSGGLYYDAYPGFATTATKTFTVPAYTDIKWARLYTVVYSGHMNNNYRGNATISIDANGDSSYEIQNAETFNSTYSFPGLGGSGPIWFSDHMNRVTSDYLMWYDLTDAISGQTVNVQASTAKIDPTFDGRIKAIVLVVAYDDGDTDTVQYWVNQGHDTVNKDDTTYTGSTVFGTNTLAAGWNSANLTAIHLASQDGSYTFLGDAIPSGTPQGSYFGTNTWDVTGKLTAGEQSDMGYTRIAEYYKIPLALLSVRYTGTTPVAPVAAFSGTPTAGTVPLTVAFTDESTGTPTSWLWDFGDSDSTNATEQNPVHTYSTTGTYTVNLTATNSAGSNTTSKADYVTVSSAGPEAPVAAFSANTTSGTAPLTVAFTDESSNTPTSWKWEYKTGVGSWTQFSTDKNATYTFAEGTYDIRLTATNAGGSDTKTQTGYITAGAPSIEVSVGPTAITFGTMSTSAPSTGSTQVTVTTSGGTAWSVTASDNDAATKGYMATTTDTKLATPFQLANGGAFQDLTADFTSFMSGSGAGTTNKNADVQQTIAGADAPGDYAITVTFTGVFV